MMFLILLLIFLVAYSLYAAWDSRRDDTNLRDEDVIGKYYLKLWKTVAIFRNH